jgi:hypothetical protein
METAATEQPQIPQLEVEYVFQVKLKFTERHRISTPAGRRVYVPIESGEVWGPKLQGRVLPRSGGDYADVYGLEAHYMLEADDGSLIYLHNRGYLYRVDRRETPTDDPTWGGDAEHYFRVRPEFDAPTGPHDWLTRTLIIGTGQRRSEPDDHTLFTYYAVK